MATEETLFCWGAVTQHRGLRERECVCWCISVRDRECAGMCVFVCVTDIIGVNVDRGKPEPSWRLAEAPNRQLSRASVQQKRKDLRRKLAKMNWPEKTTMKKFVTQVIFSWKMLPFVSLLPLFLLFSIENSECGQLMSVRGDSCFHGSTKSIKMSRNLFKLLLQHDPLMVSCPHFLKIWLNTQMGIY